MATNFSGILTTSDNHKIAYQHYSAGHRQAVVIAHGFFNSKDAVLLKKIKDGIIDRYDVIMFDFRGHGKSSGQFCWTSKENLDLETSLNYAQEKYSKIGLIAFSLGAAVGINVLARKDMVASLIAVSAPAEFEKIDYRFWNLDLENDIFYNLGEGMIGKGVRPGPFWLKKQKPIDSAGSVKCPILYIHGDNDWVVHYKHSQRLYDKTLSRREIKIIKNGPHAEYLLKTHTKQIIELIRYWFKETLEEEE